MIPPVLYFDLGNTLVFGPANNKTPFADAVATIEALWERGYRIGLLSDQVAGTTIADVRQKLDDYGLDQTRFDVITISSEFDPPIYKPDPQIFAAALTKAGYASASDRAVFITETLDHVQAARDLGWRAIHKPYNAACGPASGECVEDLDDLLDLFPQLPIDLYMRDSTADDGDEPSSGAFWNSPDLWIRNQDDGGTEHQNPIAGQDNWFYARVHNRGEGIARLALVGHSVQQWAGTEFLYPSDFAPVVAWIAGINVEPDVPQVLLVSWSAADVPAQGSHACWLSVVLHDADPMDLPAHVWEANNLAQKNLTIVEMGAGESATIPLVLGNRAVRKARHATIELWRPERAPALSVTLVSDSAPALAKAVRRAGTIGRATPEPKATPVGLRFLEPARVELTGLLTRTSETAILDLARGSTLGFTALEQRAEPGLRPTPVPPAPLTARLVEEKGGASAIDFGTRGASGIALGLRPGQLIRAQLRLVAPRDARPAERIAIDLVQRSDDGVIVGGVSVTVVVTGGKGTNGRSVTGKRPTQTAMQRRRKS